MKEDKLTLKDLIALGRTMEAVGNQIRDMKRSKACNITSSVFRQSESTVNQLKSETRFRKVDERELKGKRCYNCDGEYPHASGLLCPSFNKICNSFKKKNHFARCSKFKPIEFNY
jgi:hypothetical protein